ncbi:MAG: protein kinase, partial [Planctomycetes bacterium]|nr:protein kinase [Planctomycetota bacterium]
MAEPQPRNLVITGGKQPSQHDTISGPLKIPFVATPLGMMVVIPLIVASAALAALGLYHVTMADGVYEMAKARIVADAQLGRQRALVNLNQMSDTVQAMQAWASRIELASDPAAIARVLTGMAVDRPGISQAYIGLANGGLIGVTHSDAGTWQVLRVQPGPSGSRRTISDVRPDGSLVEVKIEEGVAYHARLRPWFQLASGADGVVWTEPYRFSRTGMPGVTVAKRIVGADGDVHAVVGVDIDLASFGTLMHRQGDLGRNFVFDRNRNLLALPRDLMGELPASGLPTGDNLRDPVVSTFFRSIQALPDDDEPVFSRIEIDGVVYGGMVSQLPIQQGPTWYLAQVASRDAVLGMMDVAKRKGLFGSLGAIVIGILAGLYFANLLGRARREVENQRLRARVAEQKAQELGSYNLVRMIGEGGMGQVWIGEHRMLSRPAAVKLISPRAMAGVQPEEAAEIRKRFEQEARITASLRARSTVELFDFGVAADGTFFYVMELLDGMDLRALVEKHGPQPAGRVVHILSGLLGSLAEAHDRGLVHRDIKPENIFVCRRADEVDVIKVLDFGLVRIAKAPENARLTQAGMINGTPATMAPEQAMGKELDGRTDLYAVGCVACWLLTGSDLFSADNAIELLTKHINEAPVPLRERNDAIPEELAILIEGCLAKDPARRPPDARTLAMALEALVLPPGQAWTPRRAATWWA